MQRQQLRAFSPFLVLLLFSCPFSRVRACLTWERATGHDTTAWGPGQQGSKPLGVCRYISLNSNPMGVEVGKMEAGTFCYFTSLDAGFNGSHRQNGTATIEDGFEFDKLDPRVCNVSDSSVITTPGKPLPPDAAVAGFRSDGSVLGICLVPNGEGKGSLLVGKLFLKSGSQPGHEAGVCCWSAGFKEHCIASGYRVITAKAVPPPKPPPIPPESVPPLLEPNGGIFSARLSFGPRGAPDIMGVTFGTPNTTNSSYMPIVRWATSIEELSSRILVNDKMMMMMLVTRVQGCPPPHVRARRNAVVTPSPR